MITGRHVNCPLCKEKQFINAEDKIEKYVVVNLSILNKAQIGEENKEVSRYSVGKDESNGLNIDIPKGFKCRKHKLPVHSYVKSNNALM